MKKADLNTFEMCPILECSNEHSHYDFVRSASQGIEPSSGREAINGRAHVICCTNGMTSEAQVDRVGMARDQEMGDDVQSQHLRCRKSPVPPLLKLAPDTGLPLEGYIRLPQVLSVIPISKSSWWAGVKTGRYPQSLKLGPRTTVWRVDDIRRLIEKTGVLA